MKKYATYTFKIDTRSASEKSNRKLKLKFQVKQKKVNSVGHFVIIMLMTIDIDSKR